MTLNQADALVRMADLASRPQRKERTYTDKNGNTRRISAQQPSRGMIGVSDKTIWKWIKQGTFPTPVKLSDSITAWKLSEVQAWLQAQGA
jgi:predicted DNA-binding transcriptional regulator AlpA